MSLPSRDQLPQMPTTPACVRLADFSGPHVYGACRARAQMDALEAFATLVPEVQRPQFIRDGLELIRRMCPPVDNT